MGFTYVRLLTLPQRNPAGNPLAPGPSDLYILEVQPTSRIALHPTLRGNADSELTPGSRMRRRRPDLRLARDSDRDLPVVHSHRQMRHERALDVPHDLLRRQLRGRQNMDLLDRAALALDDLCGDNSRKREDQLLSTLDREYAAGDVVQIQSFFCGDLMLWLETGGQYCRRLSVNQAKNPYSSLQASKRITAEHSTLFQGKRDA